MNDAVTLKELAAIMVRRGKFLLIVAVVTGLLLGIWQVRSLQRAAAENYSPEKIEERYQEAMWEYQQEKSVLEKDIRYGEMIVERWKNSLLMQIDPDNKAVTTIRVFIQGIENSSELMVARLGSQYIQLWDSVDLQNALSHEAEDHYLREVLFLEAEAGGILKLTAWGETTAISQQLAKDAYEYLLELERTVDFKVMPHGLADYEETTVLTKDVTLAQEQASIMNRVKSFKGNGEVQKRQLESLREPTRETAPTQSQIMKAGISAAAFGVAVGIVLGMVWVMITYLLRNRMEISCHLAERLAVPMLGSVAKQEDIFCEVADRILGEHCWQGEEQALAWLSENIEAHMQNCDSSVAIVSTLKIDENDNGVRVLKKALQGKNLKVHFADRASNNPAAIATIRESGQIILLERCGASRWQEIESVAELAKSLEKPICGFVLI